VLTVLSRGESHGYEIVQALRQVEALAVSESTVYPILARLRADGRRVCIRPATAATVYRQNFDGEWETLPAEETTVHFGVVYKDSMGGLYFELRNG